MTMNEDQLTAGSVGVRAGNTQRCCCYIYDLEILCNHLNCVFLFYLFYIIIINQCFISNDFFFILLFASIQFWQCFCYFIAHFIYILFCIQYSTPICWLLMTTTQSVFVCVGWCGSKDFFVCNLKWNKTPQKQQKII